MRWENAMGRGLLVAAFDFSTAHTDEFHDCTIWSIFPSARRFRGSVLVNV
jgi:hypothetical protein